MFDPVYQCYKVQASPSFIGDDYRQFVFGFDYGLAKLEAVELCERGGLTLLDITFHSEHPLSYWNGEENV